MTDIVFNTKALTLTAKGHTGEAPRGESLLCCAVSTLMYGLTAALDEFEVPYDCSEGEGFMEICLKPCIADAAAYTVFYAFIAALLELGRQYREISVRKERT